MIILDGTTKSLEVKLAGTVTTSQLAWTLSAVDLDATFALSAIVGGDGLTNNTTAVVLLAAPAAGHLRQVKLLTVYNADTVSATVTVQLHSGANLRPQAREVLAPGETLYFVS